MDNKVVKVGDVWQDNGGNFTVKYLWVEKAFIVSHDGHEDIYRRCFIVNSCKLIERDGKKVIEVPQGEELIGILCGISDISIEKAKENSMRFDYVGLIRGYVNSKYSIGSGSNWKYAYPISAKNIKLWDGE